MLAAGTVEDGAVRELALEEVPPRPTDEVVRLADRRGHDPLAARRLGCLRRDPRRDVLVVGGVREVDERLGENPEMHQVGMSVHQTWQDCRPFDVDEPRLWSRCGPGLVEAAECRHATVSDRKRPRARARTVAGHNVPAVQHDRSHRVRRIRRGTLWASCPHLAAAFTASIWWL